MPRLQRLGGLAALFEAVTYVVGFVLMVVSFTPAGAQHWSAAQKLEFLLARKGLFQAWSLFIYVAFGVALVALVMALHERWRAAAPSLMTVATPFGLIWAGLVIASGMVASTGIEAVAALHARDVAQAAAAWVAIAAVQDGLGGGVEIVGGVWMILASVACLGSVGLPRALGYLGLLVGGAGALTVVPALGDLGAVFGLGQIAWFVWIGLLMMRRSPPIAPSTVG